MKKTLLVALVIVSLIFGIVAYAFAANAPDVTSDVTINARVNPKLTMTVASDAGGTPLSVVNWLGIEPDAANLTQPVFITISSNKAGTLSAAWDVDPTTANYNITSGIEALSQGFTNTAGQVKNDTITFDPDYDTPSDTAAGQSFKLTYTAAQ